MKGMMSTWFDHSDTRAHADCGLGVGGSIIFRILIFVSAALAALGSSTAEGYYVKFAAEISANAPGFPFSVFENINTGNLLNTQVFTQPLAGC
jgi:hypothetical protein